MEAPKQILTEEQITALKENPAVKKQFEEFKYENIDTTNLNATPPFEIEGFAGVFDFDCKDKNCWELRFFSNKYQDSNVASLSFSTGITFQNE